MTETASDLLIKRLDEWGVRRICGYPGDGINAIMGALDRHQDKITFIQTRHEEEAAFMATVHAKFTGEVGVCFTGVGYARPRIVAEKSELEHAARVLNEGNKVAMLVGAGALNATDQVIATAELLGAGIAKASLQRLGWFRVSLQEEKEGSDRATHGEKAYEDM